MKSDALINEIINTTRQNIDYAGELNSKSEKELTWKENDESWSILECLEHLNLYSKFYNPEIKAAIEHSQFKPDPEFKSGIFGNYFVKSMTPKEKLNKMKTARDKNPVGTNPGNEVIENFMNQQQEFINLLENSRGVNLNKVKTRISISKIIKLKLGDTLMLINNHTLRHLKQIERIQKNSRI